MKLIDYIRNAKDYIYFSMKQNPLDKLLASNESEHFMIIPNSLTIHRKDFVEVLKKYYLVELYELSNCFLGTYKEHYMFLHLVSTPVDSIKVAVYEKTAHLYRDDVFDPDCGKIRLSDKYTDSFLRYLQTVDKWSATDVQPKDVEYEQYFRTIPMNEFNKEIIYTRFYMDYNTETRHVLCNENLVQLSDVADIIPTRLVSGSEIINGRTLDVNRFPKYPYIPELDTIEHPMTNLKLQKGDIIEHHNKFFLVDKEADFDVYAPHPVNIIRAHSDFSPEYLFLYLRSRIAWRIRSVLSIPAGEKTRAISKGLSEFPIVLPKEDFSVYQERFLKLASPDERLYQKLVTPKSQDSVDDILKTELIEMISLNNADLLRKQINKDIRELNNCYDVKVYKSAMMLVGSMLETFLLDWISELEGVNYFENEMKYQKHNGTTATADLYYYIKYIKKRFSPKWNYYADLAHDIRENRNIVHVKLCLKRSEEITDELCLQMIENLKEILYSREKMN